MSVRIEASTRESGAYAEACGRVRALEKGLLGAEALETLLGLPTAASLEEALVGRGILAGGEAGLAGDWEAALARAGAAADRLLLRIDPRPGVSRLLVLRHDLANLRVLLRARVLGREYDGSWHPRATLDRAALERAVSRGGTGVLPAPVAAAVRAIAADGGVVSFREIDDRVDAAWLAALREEARAAGSGFFLDWLGHFADLANIRSRLRFLGSPGAWDGPPVALPGGRLDPGALDVAGGAEALLRRLARTVYGPLLARATGADGLLRPARLDRAADDLLTGLLRPARRLALGPEPLWAWHLARDVDAKNVRALMIGRLHGLPTERIRGLLRQPYA